jgi:hypothetical protein
MAKKGLEEIGMLDQPPKPRCQECTHLVWYRGNLSHYGNSAI